LDVVVVDCLFVFAFGESDGCVDAVLNVFHDVGSVFVAVEVCHFVGPCVG